MQSIQETYAPNLARFGCGPANPTGLHIRSFPSGDALGAEWQPSTEYEATVGMVSGGRLAREDFVLPLFVSPGTGVRRQISSMPGVFNLSIDEVTKEVAAAHDLGVRSIILFGLPESKDELASGAYAEDGIVQRA